ncbi:MAG: molybdopterin biosynthesis protein, partial [Hyphomicrobiales bacterium]|nr:molybdopterin biosynthesis protein [Hyphomicrobiales bacterium]
MKATPPDASLAQDQFLTILSREDAVTRFDAALFPRDVPHERVALQKSLSRVLAQDVLAPIDVPPFDRSNVDGFALRATDVAHASEAGAVRLTLNDEIIACGTAPKLRVAPGSATPIATGGPVPRGADAIVMIEQTQPANGAVDVRRAATPGQFISSAGSDMARGETVLRAGVEITAREVG